MSRAYIGWWNNGIGDFIVVVIICKYICKYFFMHKRSVRVSWHISKILDSISSPRHKNVKHYFFLNIHWYLFSYMLADVDEIQCQIIYLEDAENNVSISRYVMMMIMILLYQLTHSMAQKPKKKKVAFIQNLLIQVPVAK